MIIEGGITITRIKNDCWWALTCNPVSDIIFMAAKSTKICPDFIFKVLKQHGVYNAHCMLEQLHMQGWKI